MLFEKNSIKKFQKKLFNGHFLKGQIEWNKPHKKFNSTLSKIVRKKIILSRRKTQKKNFSLFKTKKNSF